MEQKEDGFNVENPDQDCFLRQSESSDGGYTWTTPEKTVIKGFPAHLLKLKNGMDIGFVQC